MWEARDPVLNKLVFWRSELLFESIGDFIVDSGESCLVRDAPVMYSCFGCSEWCLFANTFVSDTV